MRKEYDLGKGERGKFFGRVETGNAQIIDDETLDQTLENELAVLESNHARIKLLQPRLAELDAAARERIAERVSSASDILEELALSR